MFAWVAAELALLAAAVAEPDALFAWLAAVVAAVAALLALPAALWADDAAAVALVWAPCSAARALLIFADAALTADTRSVAVSGVTWSLRKKPAGAEMLPLTETTMMPTIRRVD